MSRLTPAQGSTRWPRIAHARQLRRTPILMAAVALREALTRGIDVGGISDLIGHRIEARAAIDLEFTLHLRATQAVIGGKHGREKQRECEPTGVLRLERAVIGMSIASSMNWAAAEKWQHESRTERRVDGRDMRRRQVIFESGREAFGHHDVIARRRCKRRRAGQCDAPRTVRARVDPVGHRRTHGCNDQRIARGPADRHQLMDR